MDFEVKIVMKFQKFFDVSYAKINSTTNVVLYLMLNPTQCMPFYTQNH